MQLSSKFKCHIRILKSILISVAPTISLSHVHRLCTSGNMTMLAQLLQMDLHRLLLLLQANTVLRRTSYIVCYFIATDSAKNSNQCIITIILKTAALKNAKNAARSPPSIPNSLSCCPTTFQIGCNMLFNNNSARLNMISQ